MDIKVNNVIVHRVKKEQRGTTKVTLRSKPFKFLNKEGDTTFDFVCDFTEVFLNRKTTHRLFGEFEEDKTIYPVSEYLDQFYENKMTFLQLSELITKRFDSNIKAIPMATGGFLFFIDYEYKNEKNFAVVVLTNKNRTSIDEDTLDLLPSLSLDTEEINMATNYKRDKKLAGESGYLSFIRGIKTVSDYFQRTMGCKKTASGAVATNAVIDSMLDYIDTTPLINNEDRESVKEAAKQVLFSTMEKNRTELDFETISCCVFPDNTIRSGYLSYIDNSAEKYPPIPDCFTPDKRAYDKLKRFIFKSKGIDLKIDLNLFDSLAFFDDDNYLVIKDPSIKQRFNEI